MTREASTIKRDGNANLKPEGESGRTGFLRGEGEGEEMAADADGDWSDGDGDKAMS